LTLRQRLDFSDVCPGQCPFIRDVGPNESTWGPGQNVLSRRRLIAYNTRFHTDCSKSRRLVVEMVAIWSWVPGTLNLLGLLLGLFLILLVLIQRGKGGGLAGAFGGVGGSSAFGSRAGDTFTRITIGVAAVWLSILMLQVWAVQAEARQKEQEGVIQTQ